MADPRRFTPALTLREVALLRDVIGEHVLRGAPLSGDDCACHGCGCACHEHARGEDGHPEADCKCHHCGCPCHAKIARGTWERVHHKLARAVTIATERGAHPQTSPIDVQLPLFRGDE